VIQGIDYIYEFACTITGLSLVEAVDRLWMKKPVPVVWLFVHKSYTAYPHDVSPQVLFLG
jgi:hypothetical protein